MTNGTKWRIAVVVLLAFFAGMAVGVFGAAHQVRRFMFEHHPPHFRGRMAEHLRRELRLTPEQFAKIQPIIQRSADQLDQIRQETNQRVRETIRQAHSEMVPFLTPDQKTRLDQMEERHRRGLHDRPPP